MVAQLEKNLPAIQKPGFNPFVGKIPWRREWQPTPVCGLENSMNCIIHGVTNCQSWLSNFHFSPILIGTTSWGFPASIIGKESDSNAGDPGSIPGLGKSSREGIGYPLQYSYLENALDRGSWWATKHQTRQSN